MYAINGIILLDKPSGISSAGAVNVVKRLLPRGTKIGHAGTLDPFATGLLIVLVGKATKTCEARMNAAKQYEAIIRFGATTPTDDPESPPTFVENATTPSKVMLEDALKQFVGDIAQLPPLYSALKIGGRRACDRVRDGQTVELKPRMVRVDRIELLDYAWPEATVRIDCGRGTYIRSIARDVGKILSVGGYLSKLRRTRSGEFSVEQAQTLEQLRSDGVERHLLLSSALPNVPPPL